MQSVVINRQLLKDDLSQDEKALVRVNFRLSSLLCETRAPFANFASPDMEKLLPENCLRFSAMR